MPQLIRGLRLLSQSDPCAEVFQQKTGEWVILTAGELHLEVRRRCSISAFHEITMFQYQEVLEGFKREIRESRNSGITTYRSIPRDSHQGPR